MGHFVDSKRLWPLLAYFAFAIVVVIGADVIVDLATADSATVWTVVGVWLVLTPWGAWHVWKRSAGS